MLQNADSFESLAPEMLAPILSTLYDLAEPIGCAWLSSGLNDVFRVTTGTGPFILKMYRAGWRNHTEVQEEIAALFHLHRKGVHVALPVARRDGAFAWSAHIAGRERQVVLFTFAKGDPMPSSGQTYYRLLGETLAQLHNATDDFAGAPVWYDLEHLFIRPLRILEPYLDDRPEDREFLRETVVRLRTRIESLPSGALDRGYCHGDFRAPNMCLDENTGIVTLFDLELGGMGFRAYDIAITQTNMHPMAFELLWGAPAPDNEEAGWTAFLDGYAECRPLRPENREVLPIFVAMRPVQIMSTLVQMARETPGRDHWPPSEGSGLPGGDLFERALRFLRAWNAAYL